MSWGVPGGSRITMTLAEMLRIVEKTASWNYFFFPCNARFLESSSEMGRGAVGLERWKEILLYITFLSWPSSKEFRVMYMVPFLLTATP